METKTIDPISPQDGQGKFGKTTIKKVAANTAKFAGAATIGAAATASVMAKDADAEEVLEEVELMEETVSPPGDINESISEGHAYVNPNDVRIEVEEVEDASEEMAEDVEAVIEYDYDNGESGSDETAYVEPEPITEEGTEVEAESLMMEVSPSDSQIAEVDLEIDDEDDSELLADESVDDFDDIDVADDILNA